MLPAVTDHTSHPGPIENPYTSGLCVRAVNSPAFLENRMEMPLHNLRQVHTKRLCALLFFENLTEIDATTNV